ncbi:unnamed protein product [Prorocentrum cordatum]|uniref:Uncharacterized protein n=1 Tax=Prorocentrum cordatum TaxID=2364126 RepID=A0ABN9XZQ4_9DINO|nr:unnamed protein product [Polarella glacialis]
MPRMHEDIKALRALHRHEDILFRNQQLDTAIKHKANSLKKAKQMDRKVMQCFKAYEKAKKKAEDAEYAWLQACEHAVDLHGQHDRARKLVIDTGGLYRARGRKALGFGA